MCLMGTSFLLMELVHLLRRIRGSWMLRLLGFLLEVLANSHEVVLLLRLGRHQLPSGLESKRLNFRNYPILRISIWPRSQMCRGIFLSLIKDRLQSKMGSEKLNPHNLPTVLTIILGEILNALLLVFHKNRSRERTENRQKGKR